MVTEIPASFIELQQYDMLTTIPSMDEVKNAIFGLNKGSVPGPDRFGGLFYHTNWGYRSHKGL